MLYVIYMDIDNKRYIGIKKKVIGQSKAFERIFGKAYYTSYCGQTLYLCANEEIIDKAHAITIKECNEKIIHWIDKYSINNVYIRYPMSSKAFLDFLKYLKDNDVKCIQEFQTFPYDDLGIRGRYIEDHYYREMLHEYLDCCTTYIKVNYVLGIPCIPLVNGIDVDNNRKKREEYNKRDITLIAVANMMREHGYERIIQGMYEYYKDRVERKIYLKLVGEGSQISYYKRLVEEYSLEEYVEFCGFVIGKKLDELYDVADIGLGSLGSYKSNQVEGAGIKVYEYCARGLPIIYDNIEKCLDNKFFVMKVISEDVPLNIADIFEFYDCLQARDYISEIHNFAVENFSWDKVLEPVIKFYKMDKEEESI